MTNLSQVNPTEINISVESKKNGATESKPAKTDTSSAKENDVVKPVAAKKRKDTFFGINRDKIFVGVESEKDRQVFKASLNDDGSGAFDIVSLKRIKSLDNISDAVEVSGVQIADANTYVVLEDGEFVKDPNGYYKITKPLKIKLFREESDAELFKSSLEQDGINNDFIEASLFDDLSGNVAEAEKAFSFDEFDVSLQDKLFNQSEINNAEDRKKKC
jgi:hypothetical protein